MINIGDKLRAFRTKRGLTQENIAEVLEMSVGNYAHIEQGKNKVTIQKLDDIASKLNIDLFELLTINEKEIIYIHGGNHDSSQNAYIIHNTLPADYQSEVLKNKELVAQNLLYKTENELLKQQNENLKEIIGLMKANK